MINGIVMSGNIFNKLRVIESLPSGELRTGKNLFDNQLDKAKQVQQEAARNRFFLQPRWVEIEIRNRI